MSKERPILFSGPMVRALNDGTKTQTRRVVKLPSWAIDQGVELADVCRITTTAGDFYAHDGEDSWVIPCPYGVPGDQLWVRETFYQLGHWEPVEGKLTKGGKQKWKFVADAPDYAFDPPSEFRKGRHHKDPATVAWHKRLGRFMPRAASRITLDVVAVRVERLHDISEEDAKAEGIVWQEPTAKDRAEGATEGVWIVPGVFQPLGQPMWATTAALAYRFLWEAIHGKESCAANPWVWVVEFKRKEDA